MITNNIGIFNDKGIRNTAKEKFNYVIEEIIQYIHKTDED